MNAVGELNPHWTEDTEAAWSTVTWRAILLGAAVALAAQALLALLGAGVGFAMVDATTATEDALRKAALGAGLWLIASNVLSIYLGAWTSSEVTPPGTERAGALQGIGVWAVTTLAGTLLAGSMFAGYAGSAATMSAMATRFESLATAPAALSVPAASQRPAVLVQAQQQPEPPRRGRPTTAAKATSTAAFMMFVAGALGVIAAGFGGNRNRRRRIDLHRKYLDSQRTAVRSV